MRHRLKKSAHQVKIHKSSLDCSYQDDGTSNTVDTIKKDWYKNFMNLSIFVDSDLDEFYVEEIKAKNAFPITIQNLLLIFGDNATWLI